MSLGARPGNSATRAAWGEPGSAARELMRKRNLMALRGAAGGGCLAFDWDTMLPPPAFLPRRVGRPKHNWTGFTLALAFLWASLLDGFHPGPSPSLGTLALLWAWVHFLVTVCIEHSAVL